MKRSFASVIMLAVVLGTSGTILAYSGGDGSASNPYNISDANDLMELAGRTEDYMLSFELTEDIDLEGRVFSKAVIAPDTESRYDFQGTAFRGTFDGKGKKIRNLKIIGNYKDFLGLFGNVGRYGKVRNLELADVDITGGSFVGGIAGEVGSDASITACHTTGSVRGNRYVGGIAGENYSFGLITKCYSTAVIHGGSDVGGLAGENLGQITLSYFAGEVHGSYDNVGGIAGAVRAGSVTSSHSMGPVAGRYYVGGVVGKIGDCSNGGTITSCCAAGTVTGLEQVGGLVGYVNQYAVVTTCYARGNVSGNKSIGGLIGENYQGGVVQCYSTGKPTGISDLGGLCGKVTTGGSYYKDTKNFWDQQTSETDIGAMGTGRTTAEMKTLSTFKSTPGAWNFTTVWAICEQTNYPRLRWQIPTTDWICPDGVSVEDVSYLAGQWLNGDCGTSGHCAGTDLNTSGTVDLADFAVFADQWLEGV